MTIKHSLITCYLMMMIRCYSALSSLPAPVNPKVNSTNFHHVLTWDPGPGTPPGTQYIVYRRINNTTKKFKPSNSTSRKLKLLHTRRYTLSVQASLNMFTSPESKSYTFFPYADTIISPPMLSVAGCGTCIQLNISMPKADNNSILRPDNDIQKLYAFSFRIYCRKESEEKVTEQDTRNTSYRVKNLEAGVKYCIKVKPMITLNKHSSPSEWKCDYTSRLEPSRGPAVVSSLASILVVGGVVLVLLYYTGFLCRLQHLPVFLKEIVVPVIPRYFLTPERTTPDSVSILSDPEQQMMATNRRPLRPNMELEEEDEGENLYIQSGRATVGGAAELSSGASSDLDSDSQNTSGPGVPAAAIWRGCGSLRGVVELAAEGVEPGAEPGGHGQITEGKGGMATVLYPEPDLDQPGFLGHVGKAIEEEEEMREEGEQNGGENSSGHVNLFAVTLGSHEEDDVNLFSLTLGSQEEDEEEYDEAQSDKDFLRLCDERPLLPTDSPPRTSGDKGAQRETLSGDGTLKAGLTETDPQNGYVDRHAAGATETNFETEEEEEFSGYMVRR